MDIRDRIQKVLRDHNDASIYSLAKTANERTNMQRQINGDVTVSVQTLKRVVEAFPETSMHWLVTGEGSQERTKIVTPPQHRQDIHLAEGATAAISQNGEAKVEQPTPKEEPKSDELFTPSDLARMMREQDVAGLVSIILQQKDEIIRIQREHITSMRAEMQFVDKTIFPPVK